jgi:hypothetical protein
MSIISIPKILIERLGEDGSEALATMLNRFGEENKQSAIDIAATRFETKLTEEASGIREDIARVESRFDSKLAKETALIREDMAGLESRFDAKLTEEISLVRQDMAGMESRFDTKLAQETALIREDMSKNQTNSLKWMFIFWVGQIGALIGILFAFFN